MSNVELTPYAHKSWAADPRDVLSGAYNADLKEVYIMGRDKNNDIYLASSGVTDYGRANLYLDMFKKVIRENWEDDPRS